MRAAQLRPPRAVPTAARITAGLPAAALLAAALGASLAGCAGSLFQSKAPPANTYVLRADIGHAPEQVSAGAAAPLTAAGLSVPRPRVRTGLDTDRIAVLYPDRRLDYFAAARWSGPLDQMVQDLALQAFHTGAHLGHVTDETSAFPSGYWLEIEVADFQAEYGSAGAAPTVHVRLLARLGAMRDRRVLGTFDANIHESAPDNRLSAIVGTYERAAAAALAQIVSDTSRVLEGASNEANPVASARR
jgi:cholesterol transport system auxiliary component